MGSYNEESSTINIQPQAQDEVLIKTAASSAQLTLKEQLKTLSLEERYILLSSINIEERNAYNKQQEKIAKEEEDKLAKCPVSKQVQLMNLEIQDLKIELQKLKNKTNESNVNTMKCPYSIFRFKDTQDYLSNSDLDLCNEITETYTSSFSWWSTIMFIVFILFVLTAKPSKHCEEFFTTRM